MTISTYINIVFPEKISISSLVFFLLDKYSLFESRPGFTLVSIGSSKWDYQALPIKKEIITSLSENESGLIFSYKNEGLSITQVEKSIIITIMTPKMIDKNLVDFGWYAEFIRECINAFGFGYIGIKFEQYP